MAKKERQNPPVRKNDIIDMEITGISSEGNGVGKPGGFAVFVPLSDIGDRLRVRIVKVLKSFAYGKIERMLAPSKRRVDNDCPYYSQCGGCCFRHIRYDAELAVKEDRVRDALRRIGELGDVPVKPIVRCAETDGYRNKALLPVGTAMDGNLIMGFYAPGSHRIIDMDRCRLQPDFFATAMGLFREWAVSHGISLYDETAHTGLLRRLYLRLAETSREVMVCVVVNGETLPHQDSLLASLRENLPGFQSLVVNSNRDDTNVALGPDNRIVSGSRTITDTLCGLSFDISPASFYQVNRTQAENLYGIARSYAQLSPGDTLLDLYCGTGTIGLSMAADAGSLIGVESVASAVRDARDNAAKNGIQNAEFICADAYKAAQELEQRKVKPDVVVIDPPRKGCQKEVIEIICRLSPRRVVYVSCDPATLSRDLRIFAELGYETQEVTPVDMFPRTAHVETVVLLSKLVGLQLIYTICSTPKSIILSNAFGCIPSRGGSNTIKSGFSPIESITFNTSPTINSQFSSPLISAFTFAARTASSTISTPTTFLATGANICAIVPVPEYRSNITLSLVSPTYSLAVS